MTLKCYSRICFVGTQYALMLYLIHSSFKEIKDTLFIFGDGIDHGTSSRFKNKISLIDKPNIFKKNDIIGIIYSLYIRFFKLRGLSKKIEIFAQDHLLDSGTIIRNREYTLIEDSAHKCSYYEHDDPNFSVNRKLRGSLRYFIKRFFYGGTAYGSIGDNEQCKAVLMSLYDNADYLKGKEIIVCDLKKDWDNSSTEKQDYIKQVFDFNKDDLDALNRDFIVFTQPLYPDVLTKQEHIQLYKNLIDNYPQSSIVIKVHPRDLVEYEKYFPDAVVFRKQIPSQFLGLMGLHSKKAITFFSSAVYSINKDAEIDWIGTEIHPKLYARFGHCAPPNHD